MANRASINSAASKSVAPISGYRSTSGLTALMRLPMWSFPAETAVAQCREVNDYLAQAIKRHPDRLAGFAAIPTSVPSACAAKELGMVGSLIGNRVDGRFLDEPCFEDFLAKCEELDVPIYLHPGLPPAEVTARCYTGDRLSADVSSVLSRYGLGWHLMSGFT